MAREIGEGPRPGGVPDGLSLEGPGDGAGDAYGVCSGDVGAGRVGWWAPTLSLLAKTRVLQ